MIDERPPDFTRGWAGDGSWTDPDAPLAVREAVAEIRRSRDFFAGSPTVEHWRAQQAEAAIGNKAAFAGKHKAKR